MRTSTLIRSTVLLAALGTVPWCGICASAQEIRGAAEFSEIKHDESPPLRDIPPISPEAGAERETEPLLSIRRIQLGPSRPDPVVQTSVGLLAAPATILNVEGVGEGFTGPSGPYAVNSVPPDTNGAVGPNHYVQWVNTSFAVFNKSGVPLYGPVTGNTLWAGFGGGCQVNNDGDPIVRYDKMADRWVFLQVSVKAPYPYSICVAVSSTGDPTGTYHRYAFTFSDVPDYPKLGIWPDGYYLTVNRFDFSIDPSFLGGEICALDRSKMLAGLTASAQCFDAGVNFGGLLASDLDGIQLPPSGSPNYVLALGATDGTLAFWKFHVDWTTPANSTFAGPTLIPTAAYTLPCAGTGKVCIPQAGTSQQLDSIGDRLMYRLAYRNFGDHESLVANHSVSAGSGVGIRWYELRLPSGIPTIFQQGTYAPDADFRWMGSIAMDAAGNLGLGFSLSGTALYPEIHYTGRLATDPLGVMGQGEGIIADGTGSQESVSQVAPRWGDYSSLSVDPADDCTFWYTTEYLAVNGTLNWRTKIATFKFPDCGNPDYALSATPPSRTIITGQNGAYAVTITPSNKFSGDVSLSITGLPASAGGSFKPNPAIGSSTLTVTTSSTTLPGTYTATIHGTSGSLTHSTTVTVVIKEPPTTTGLTAGPTPSTYGQTVTFTASVSGGVGSTPTGTVTFKDGTATLATVALSSGKATLTTATLAAGPHSITASYGGSANYSASTSSLVTQTVNVSATSTQLASSVNPSAFGQSVTITATVKPAFGGTPSGAVTFQDGPTVLAVVNLSSGKAAFTTSTLALASHSITASYRGTRNYSASTSPVVTQTVKVSATSTLLASSLNPSQLSQSATFTATVKPAFGGTPTGAVTFKDSTTVLATATLSSGQAAFTTSALTQGSHSITASYGGSTNYHTSTSSVLTQTVTGSVTSTSVALTSSVNPSVPFQSVTFTATVTLPFGGTPTGSVTFKDGSTVLANVNISSGQAAYTTSTLAIGSHSITAVYNGTASPVLKQIVGF